MTAEDRETSGVSIFDTHCHLDAIEFDPDRDAVIARSRAAGVSRWLVPAVSVATFEQTAEVGKREGVCLAWGLHPVYLAKHRPEDLALLEVQIQRVRPVAVGEIGLDFFLRDLDREAQMTLFRSQLRLARDYDLPVVLHCRKANDELVRELRRFGVTKGIVHAFNGSLQQAQALIEQGMCLGFGGNLTYDRALNIRRLAVALPLESIVLETDAPDIAPSFAAGLRNEPANLLRIAQNLADLCQISLSSLARATFSNAERVLGMSIPV